jgi:hypothetical protein
MGAYGATSSKSGTNTAATTMWNIWSTGNTLWIQTLIVSMPVAPTTIPDLYVVRSTVRGTQTTTQAGQPMDPSDASTVNGTLDSAWSTPPTVNAATTALARLPLALAAGATFYVTDEILNSPWVRGSAGLAIVNGNATGATLGTFVLSTKWRE